MQHSQEAKISEVIDSSITLCNNCQIKANINSYMITKSLILLVTLNHCIYLFTLCDFVINIAALDC